jgi:hypothetical protein
MGETTAKDETLRKCCLFRLFTSDSQKKRGVWS